MGSLALTAPDSWGFLSGSTLYAGAVNGFVDANATSPRTVTSYYLGATVATPVTGLRTGASFDYIDIHQANNDDYSLAGYLSYQATEKLSFHLRGEYFKDKLSGAPNSSGLLFANTGTTGKAEVMALTATTQYDLWKNVISRLELRWDHSLLGNDFFGGTVAGNPNATGQGAKNAWLLASNVIYKF
jgi:hypothetical protein